MMDLRQVGDLTASLDGLAASMRGAMTEEPGHAVRRLRAALAGYGQTGNPEYLDYAISLADGLTRNEILRQLDRDGAAILWSLGGAARIHRSRLDSHLHDLDDAALWC